jgi:hypothetical protein
MPSPIEDYALIGDCETAALVARDGSVDWLCFPRFDSAACFAALLATPEQGRWLLTPIDTIQTIRRHYREGTLVLETEYQTDSGVVAKVGDGVAQVVPGDKVIIGWPWCDEYRNCLDGQPRYCLRTGDALVSGRRFKGELRGETAYSRDGQPLNGRFFGQSSFATHSIVSTDALVKVADDVPLELLGPLACGLPPEPVPSTTRRVRAWAPPF